MRRLAHLHVRLGKPCNAVPLGEALPGTLAREHIGAATTLADLVAPAVRVAVAPDKALELMVERLVDELGPDELPHLDRERAHVGRDRVLDLEATTSAPREDEVDGEEGGATALVGGSDEAEVHCLDRNAEQERAGCRAHVRGRGARRGARRGGGGGGASRDGRVMLRLCERGDRVSSGPLQARALVLTSRGSHKDKAAMRT